MILIINNTIQNLLLLNDVIYIIEILLKMVFYKINLKG